MGLSRHEGEELAGERLASHVGPGAAGTKQCVVWGQLGT